MDRWLSRPLLAQAVQPVVDDMAIDQDTCNHVWILDKSSEVVRIVCAKCGKVMNP
jgi:autonomous glycyl radical cofactor GrcA